MEEKPIYKTGLVLSGGGARGFAHLGVIQAMLEIGIRPDIISGTSAGAIAGVMIASGHTPEECMNFFKSKKILNFMRPIMSKKGLMSMNGLEEQLANFIKVTTFEELQIPLVVTASDINGVSPVHFSHGELISHIIASCSIPVIFVPKQIENIEYVDGGVFMNLPVRPIRKQCEQIIAVEINSISTSEKVSNMIHMAERTFHLGINRNTDVDREMCDIFIAPEDMTKYSMLSFDHINEIYETGYNTAQKILKQSMSGIKQIPI